MKRAGGAYRILRGSQVDNLMAQLSPEDSLMEPLHSRVLFQLQGQHRAASTPIPSQ